MTQHSDDRPEDTAPPRDPEPKEFVATVDDDIRLATVFGFAAGLFAGAVLAWVVTRDR